MFAGRDKHGIDDIVLLIINTYWESCHIRLPELPSNLKWSIAVDTGASNCWDCIIHSDFVFDDLGISLDVQLRSVMVLEAVRK
jgi:hypothetical protein